MKFSKHDLKLQRASLLVLTEADIGYLSLAQLDQMFAVIFTLAIATILAVYDCLMTPIGWSWAMLVWLYALACFLINDHVRLKAYRLFDLKNNVMRVRRRIKHRVGQHFSQQPYCGWL